MADGEVKIDTKLDTSGLDKGIKDMKNKLDGASKTLDAAAAQKENGDAEKYIKANTKALQEQIKAMKLKASVTGEEIDAGKMYNAYMQSYIDLIAKSNGLVTENNQAAKKRLATLQEWAKKSKDAEEKGKGFADKLKEIRAGAVAAVGAVSGVAVAVKKTVDALKQANEAYKVQEKAERALQKAAENNPYLNSESVQHLKDYASEIQSVSNFGDEGTIDVMAQLAAAGRTESEIMKLVAAAADYAAAKHISLESAVQNLNKSYGGLAGELGELFPEVKALTAEQLKNGEAVDIIAKKYKGFAQEAADSGTQAKNTFGDFMKSLGRLANPTFEALSQKAKAFWKDMTSHMSKFNDALETASRKWGIGGIHRAVNEGVDVINTTYKNATTGEEKRGASFQTKEYLEWLKQELELRGKLNAEEESALTEVTLELSYRERVAKYEQKQAEAAAKRNAENKKALEIQSTADDYAAASTKALQEQIKAMELKADVTGKEIDAGEMYNAYMQSYIDLIAKSNGLVKENSQAAKERLAILQEWAKKAKDAATNEERLAAAQQAGEAALQAAESLGYNSKFDEYKAREEELLQMKKDINAAEIKDADEKRKAIENIDEELVKNRRNLWNNIASEVNGYSQQVEQIINDAAQMALETENNKMRAELANLEIKYRKGELGEEEYQKKVAEAKKKGAEMQYKIEMAQWASNILAATANTAVGVTQAIAQGGFPAGIITGALVGAAGAVQLASIMAAKPIKHFAAGGFVGGINGASMGADNTTIAARSGELVMNANQQRALWDMINGTGSAAGTGGVNLTINNSAANLVTVQPQITRGQIELMIDARVNDGLKSGRYNSGLNAANAGMSGEFYGI